MKRSFTTLILALTSLLTMAQETTQATDEFTVIGQIRKELKFTLADIEKYPSIDIADVVITNHVGEQPGTAKQLKGVLLKDLLKDLELKEESPKRFSEFYLIFTAADNYNVVYSWNEIFNSLTGDNLYVVTSRGGKKLSEMEERILILTPTDYKTGRRHIKGLSSIVVKRAE